MSLPPATTGTKLPASGQISLHDIRNHIDNASGSEASLTKSSQGTYDGINECSPDFPNTAQPYGTSEFHGYDHCTPDEPNAVYAACALPEFSCLCWSPPSGYTNAGTPRGYCIEWVQDHHTSLQPSDVSFSSMDNYGTPGCCSCNQLSHCIDTGASEEHPESTINCYNHFRVKTLGYNTYDSGWVYGWAVVESGLGGP